MRRTFDHIRAIIDGRDTLSGVVSRRVQAGVYLGRLGVSILKQWARDRCPQQASALAFQTALSLVPIMALAFTVLRSTGSLDSGESRLIEFLAVNVLPDLPDVASKLQEFSAKVSEGAAGAGGILFTLLTCYSLYGSVEKIVNDIWRVGRRRSWLQKFLTFYALVTLLPVLATVYLYWSGRLMFVAGAAQLLAPLVIQFCALLLLNKLLPATYVRWTSALVGTLVTAVALEALKWAFVAFAKRLLLTSYAGIYGPLALVPLVLVWIYSSWLLVLLGVEIANAVQNLRLLEAEERRRRGEEPVNGVVAAQLLGLVAADYRQGGSGADREDLARDLGLSVDVVSRIAERLKQRGLIAEVSGDRQGFIPGRAPETIALAEVLAVFRATDLEAAEGALAPALAAVVEELEESRRVRIEGLTVADLLPTAPEPVKLAAIRVSPRRTQVIPTQERPTPVDEPAAPRGLENQPPPAEGRKG